MPYQQNIPQPTDQLDDSQGDILGNFQEIYNLIGVNHVQFGAAAGQGKHTQVTLPENVAPTNTAIDEANIYSQLSTLTNQTELFWQRENNGTRIEWTGAGLISPNLWTRLPSGILLKWGAANINGAGTVVYPVDPSVPVFTDVSVTFTQIISAGGDPNSCVTVISGASYLPVSFDVFCSQRNLPGLGVNTVFLWITVGS